MKGRTLLLQRRAWLNALQCTLAYIRRVDALCLHQHAYGNCKGWKDPPLRIWVDRTNLNLNACMQVSLFLACLSGYADANCASDMCLGEKLKGVVKKIILPPAQVATNGTVHTAHDLGEPMCVWHSTSSGGQDIDWPAWSYGRMGCTAAAAAALRPAAAFASSCQHMGALAFKV